MASDMAERVIIVPKKLKQSSTQTPTNDLNLGRDDLSFISNIPDEIEIECPVCLQVMLTPADPHLVSCCGHHYCGPCMMRLKKDNMPCPYCKEAEYYFAMVDEGRARIINGLQVRCINEVCQWIGQLKCLPAHLNRGEREGECQYELVECKCHMKVKRIDAENHEINECSQRPYQCEYCGLFASYEWITQQHYRKCNKYPVPCPNNCQVTLVRDEVEYHTSNECPLRLVECEFEWAGCHQIIPHKDIHQHRYDSHDNHIILVRVFYEEQIQSLEECKANLIDQNQSVLRTNGTLCAEMHNLSLSYDDLNRAYDLVNKENNDLKSTLEQKAIYIRKMEKESRELNRKHDTLNSEIKDKDKEIKEKNNEIKEKDSEIEDKSKWLLYMYIIIIIMVCLWNCCNLINWLQHR